MGHPYWNDWYFGWGWILWFGFMILIFSSFGNWGYTYRAHQKYSGQMGSNALGILDERYARGDIDRQQYLELKADLASEAGSPNRPVVAKAA
jgi:putative membrane protein